jgi:hypothetical protein
MTPIAFQSRETQLEEDFDSYKLAIVDLTLDTSYPTGGSTGIAAACGFAAEGQVSPEGSSSGQIVGMVDLGESTHAATDVVARYHPDTDTLQCFWTGAAVSTALAEVANATNLSAYTKRFLILAR